MIEYNERERNNYQYIVIEIDQDTVGIDRNMFMKVLHAENILVRRYFYPGCHQMEPYRSYFPNAGLVLPETEQLIQKVLQLPTGTAVNEAEIKQICEIIRFSVANGKKLREAKKFL